MAGFLGFNMAVIFYMFIKFDENDSLNRYNDDKTGVRNLNCKKYEGLCLACNCKKLCNYFKVFSLHIKILIDEVENTFNICTCPMLLSYRYCYIFHIISKSFYNYKSFDKCRPYKLQK